jgi:hypothetical protein
MDASRNVGHRHGIAEKDLAQVQTAPANIRQFHYLIFHLLKIPVALSILTHFKDELRPGYGYFGQYDITEKQIP